MPLNKLENFIRSTDGRILYVNPSDINSTDAITNDGTSLSQPFKTIQRALLEAARFSYVKGNNNDLIEKTTILLFPGEHILDNRPGYAIYANGENAYAVPRSGGTGVLASSILSLGLESNFDLTQENNILYKFNSIYGGVVVPRGTSIVGLDLRKTKIRPKYIPNPTDSTVSNSAIFRITGACYFWQFSIFDADSTGLVYTNPDNFGSNYQSIPNFSHNKLTCFEYADGVNKITLSNGSYTDLTDLDMYYSKVSNAYNAYRSIDQKYPDSKNGFAKRNSEWEIVGAFASDPINISTIISGNGNAPTNIVTVTTTVPHNLNVGTPIKIKNVSGSGVTYPYNISTSVQNVTDTYTFTYLLPSLASYPNINPSPSGSGATVTVETDTVSGASPYIFNISLRSVWGMNGLHADGNKSSGFRSVVVAQFTAISLQKDDRAFVKYDRSSRTYQGVNYTTAYGSQLPEGSSQTDSTKIYHLDPDAVYRNGWDSVHIKISNDAFIQIVSVFAIGFNRHFDANSGGDGSITNSNSNFGQISLTASGFKKEAFSKDNKSFITSIIPPRSAGINESDVQWLTINDSLTKTIGISSHIYLSGFTSKDILPPSQAQGCRVGGKLNDTLYLTSSGSTYSAPIYMCDNIISTSGLTTASGTTSAVKNYPVISGPVSNSFTIGSNTIITGEKIRIISDIGDLPENVTEHEIYYAINNGDNNTIKLASSYTNAIQLQPIALYGGSNLSIVSRVSDKDSGDFGSPIQYDAQNGNWFIHVGANNAIFNAFIGELLPNYNTTKELAYVKRIIDQRSLDEKLYKFRVVVPKEQVNARDPENGFIIQESSFTGLRNLSDFTRTNIGSTDYEYNKNPRFIAKCSVSSNTVTVLTELPHNIQSGEIVFIKNVTSTSNPTSDNSKGYNGRFVVTNVPDAYTFQYTTTDVEGNAHIVDTFTNNVGIRSTNLPRFERNDLQENLFIYRSEVISSHIPTQQDGIYHLYVLNAKNAMSTEFTNLEFGQLTANLYPELDRDNVDSNPPAAKTFAKRSPIGAIVTNNLKNSITRESADILLKSFGIGLTISSVTPSSAGVSTVTFSRFHGLSGIATGSITPGSGYTNGTYYNVKILNNSQTGSWNGATAKVTVSGAANSITSVDIIAPGSGYSAGALYFDQTAIGAGNGAARYTVATSGISTNIGDVVQFTGVGTIASSHYRIKSILSSTQISVAQTTGDPIILPSQYAFVVGPSSKVILYTYNSTAGITTFITSTPHGLLSGNSFKITDSNGNNLGNYYVKDRNSYNEFTAITNNELPVINGFIMKHGLSANEGISNASLENYGIRQVSFYDNDYFTLNSGITTETAISIKSSGIGTANRLPLGSYIQIDNEVMRIMSSNNVSSATVIRGVLGTRQEKHEENSLIRKVSPIAVEFRRPSILRASGHTFEYLGYGPGNYSTGLPQVQVKTLNDQESFLAQSQKRSGGIVVYSGMNNAGDIFSGNTKTSASSGETVSFDIPTPTITGENPGAANVVFDDITVKNRIWVEGGASGSVLSQFDGPVAFNKEIRAKTIDVSESIRSNSYENFKFSDLPKKDEVSFSADRVLRVKDDESGYELIDTHSLEGSKLKSFGVSNDPTIYNGTATTVNGKTVINFGSTATTKFALNQRVKVFGVTESSDSADIPSPPLANTPPVNALKVGTSAEDRTYFYWISQFDLRKGKVGPAVQINPTAGIKMVEPQYFNDLNNIALTLSRTSASYGILVYRQITTSTGLVDIGSSQLVAILGPNELGGATDGIIWTDYGTFDQTSWSPKLGQNQYNTQIHFPNVATTSSRRGWAIDKIVDIGSNYITLNGQYNTNSGNSVNVVHDNTYGFTQAIDSTIASGGNYLDVPSGTYLTNNITIPSEFTLKGNGKNTIIKMQYFATDLTDGGGNSLPFNGNVVGIATTNPTDITIKEITIDGNSGNNILYEGNLDNYILYFPNISSSLIKGIEIRNSSGNGLYVNDSKRLSIEDCSFVDGCITDRYPFQPLSAQESTSLRVNDCLFENYPGPVDLSVTSVVSTGGNIIRNCGTGLRTYASGKITTTNNIILGPSDEWIPSADIYDSDYNSINFTIQRGNTFNGPKLLYLEDGSPKDISSAKVTIVSAGIGTIVGQGTTNETLGTRFLNFNIITPDTNLDGTGRQNGYIQLNLTSTQSNTLGLTSSLGYDIVAKEFLDIPVGFSTYVGIQTGSWTVIGTGSTQYTIQLKDETQFSAVSVGDVIKLKNHSSTPDLSTTELTVAEKIDSSPYVKQLRLTGFTTTSSSYINGLQTGYISIRNIFTIAKGRVGVI